MNKEEIKVITDKEDLYDKCENMEQVFDNYYLPLLDIHYKKTYEMQNDIKTLLKENEDYKSRVEKAVEYIKKDLSLGVNTFGSVYSIGANEVLNILQDGSDTSVKD